MDCWPSINLGNIIFIQRIDSIWLLNVILYNLGTQSVLEVTPSNARKRSEAQVIRDRREQLSGIQDSIL